MLAPQLKQWESEGRYLKTVLFQHKVFCKDVGNPAAPPDRTLLLLHGFPESSFSFHKVVEGLAKLFDRVVLFDFPGYGLSDKPIANYTYSLFEQADVALQVWKDARRDGRSRAVARHGRQRAHRAGRAARQRTAARVALGGLQELHLHQRQHGARSCTVAAGSEGAARRAGPLFSRLFANWSFFNRTVQRRRAMTG